MVVRSLLIFVLFLSVFVTFSSGDRNTRGPRRVDGGGASYTPEGYLSQLRNGSSQYRQNRPSLAQQRQEYQQKKQRYDPPNQRYPSPSSDFRNEYPSNNHRRPTSTQKTYPLPENRRNPTYGNGRKPQPPNNLYNPRAPVSNGNYNNNGYNNPPPSALVPYNTGRYPVETAPSNGNFNNPETSELVPYSRPTASRRYPAETPTVNNGAGGSERIVVDLSSENAGRNGQLELCFGKPDGTVCAPDRKCFGGRCVGEKFAVRWSCRGLMEGAPCGESARCEKGFCVAGLRNP